MPRQTYVTGDYDNNWPQNHHRSQRTVRLTAKVPLGKRDLLQKKRRRPVSATLIVNQVVRLKFKLRIRQVLRRPVDCKACE